MTMRAFFGDVAIMTLGTIAAAAACCQTADHSQSSWSLPPR
jgi:hypothetical protein